MNSLRYFISSIIASFSICIAFAAQVYASATITAELQGDGVIAIEASYEPACMPPGSTPHISITMCPGLYTCCWGCSQIYSGDGYSASTGYDISSKHAGDLTFSASGIGGSWRTTWQGTFCIPTSQNATTSIHYENENNPKVDAPSERVQGLTPITGEYSFNHWNESTDTNASLGICSGLYTCCVGCTPLDSRSSAGQSGELNGVYDFTGKSGFFTIWTDACRPQFCEQAKEIIYVEPPDEECNTKVGNVGTGSGSGFWGDQDFSMTGAPGTQFLRYYNSKGSEGGFGNKWRHTYDTRVVTHQIAYQVINPDGSSHYYRDRNGDNIFLPEYPKGLKSRLIKNANNTVTKFSQDGSREGFNTAGYLTSVVDRNGNTLTLTRDSINRLTKITDSSGREINITYTSKRITSIALPDGTAITYAYVSDRLRSVTYPDGSQKIFEYSGTNLIGVKNENGNYVKKYTYGSNGKVATTSIDGTNGVLTFTYVNDAETMVTDSLGRVTTYTVDKTKGMTHLTDVSGPGCKECGQGNVSYTYDDNLNVTSTTDANGNITTMTYDADGNMLTKTEAYGTPLQRTTTYTYNIFGQPLTIADPANNTTTFTYDEKGNLLSTTDEQANITTFAYNPQGLMTSMTDPQGHVTTYTYNQYGNLASATDHLGHVTSYTYDIMGKLLTMTDANNNQTTYTYDQRGRLTQVTDSLNQTTTYTYDPAGNLTAITDARNNTTQFAYDSINRLITETNALGNQRTYAYNSVSDLTTKTDANGQTTTYLYDDYNRITTINHPGGVQTTFTYDNIGNMTGTTNPNISYTMAYDALNRKTSVSDSLSRSINYTYDAKSNRVSMTDPSGTTAYVYNALNHLTNLTDPANETYTFTYDTAGKRTGLALPNEIPVSYTYDNVSRLLSIINGTVSTNSYVYDNVGNRTSMTNPSGTHNYGYDVIYRLLEATHPTPPTEQYTYDPVGNRQTDGLGHSYFYNNVNRLLNYNGVTYQYDANGNAISKQDACGVTTFTWDSENRLTGINGFSPDCTAVSVSYKYDPFGRRIEKDVNGEITRYLYDEEDILLEYDENNQIVSRYTHGPGIDEPLSMEKNGQKYYYHLDALGSVTGITDATGDIVQRYEYDSFGNIVSVIDSDFIQPYTYTAREYDPESGLYFYRARYYDAKAGRFISEDPIRLESGELNFYVYTANAPVNWVDPSGENIYGNWCGPGGSGPIRDEIDGCCYNHDHCYKGSGLTWWDQVKGNDECESCDKDLCDCLRNYVPRHINEYRGKKLIMEYFNCL